MCRATTAGRRGPRQGGPRDAPPAPEGQVQSQSNALEGVIINALV